MIEKFASEAARLPSEFLDLYHTGELKLLVSLDIPKFAPGPSLDHWRTSEWGHQP